MKDIKLYYSGKHPNLGDAANPLLIETLFVCHVLKSHYRKAEMFAVGSLLGKIAPDKRNFMRQFISHFLPPVHIWSSGFIMEPAEGTKLERKIEVAALRGALSQKALERICGKKFNVPLGDAGLLFNKIVGDVPKKKYATGIIPHYRERDMPEFKMLEQKIPHSKIIPILGDPRETLIKIAECETVISTSLHGLIAAASFNIPNIRLCHSTQITGGDFKFNDYYSAFGLESHEKISMRDALISPPMPETIIRQYPISLSQIEEIQNKLITAWPFK